MPFLALLTVWVLNPVASMEQLGIYRESSLSLFKTSDGYLLNSASEGVAVLFDRQGTVLGSYRKHGQGPNEFHRQYVLKLDDEGIHFCSNGRFVISFDRRMNPIANSLPNLPMHLPVNASFGLFWKRDSVLVALAGSSHLFAEIQIKEHGWEMGRQFIPSQAANPGHARDYLRFGRRSLVHHRTAFASKVAVSESEDSYRIEVFPKFLNTGEATHPELTLNADVGEFRPFVGMRVLISNIAKTPKGYLVELVSDMQRGGAHRRWQDHFNHLGQFMRRTNSDGRLLLPMINDHQVYTIEDRGEDRVLVPQTAM